MLLFLQREFIVPRGRPKKKETNLIVKEPKQEKLMPFNSWFLQQVSKYPKLRIEDKATVKVFFKNKGCKGKLHSVSVYENLLKEYGIQ